MSVKPNNMEHVKVSVCISSQVNDVLLLATYIFISVRPREKTKFNTVFLHEAKIKHVLFIAKYPNIRLCISSYQTVHVK